jgi:hypothetical protein
MRTAWRWGGQSTDVELWTGQVLFGRDPRPTGRDLIAGGPGLTGVLNHALLDPSMQEGEFPVLRFLDPFDVPVFNRRQIEEMVPEIERLVRWATEADELEACDDLLRLARKCLRDNKQDVFLVFIGD